MYIQLRFPYSFEQTVSINTNNVICEAIVDVDSKMKLNSDALPIGFLVSTNQSDLNPIENIWSVFF
jgi:hypothetical protein